MGERLCLLVCVHQINASERSLLRDGLDSPGEGSADPGVPSPSDSSSSFHQGHTQLELMRRNRDSTYLMRWLCLSIEGL